jgi:DNA mismatch repair protein MutL
LSQDIHILPEKLCNQIAAGEVVERPASVTKELVENSLDAGATSIHIEVERGGKRLVRVSDNGSGMGREDAFLCVERHATSKLRSEEDLSCLRTLGFRGEALPSIAAVSRMLLRTRTADSMEGWEIYLEGGDVRRAGAAGAPVGTTIEVRNLFFNLPARRKFLRRDETEFGHIADMVTKLALARPHIQFQLVHDGRLVIDVNRQKSLAERVADLLGTELLKGLVPLDYSRNGLRLQGLISQPTTTRPTANLMFTFINGRYIRDRVVHHALREGYRNLIMKGRQPVVALFLEMDPALVDVNVHPTKHEVRFRDQASVHDFIAAAVRETLQPSSWAQAESDTPATPPSGPALEMERQTEPAREIPQAFSLNRPVESRETVRETPSTYHEKEIRPASAAPFFFPAAECDATGFFGSLKVIGQYRNSYILCQDEKDLLLIDQHAAHERIAFEKLKLQHRESGVEGQQLLFPLVLDFDHREAAVIGENLPLLRQLGFELDHFGGPSFALKGVPRILTTQEGEGLIRAVVGELVSIGRSALVEQALDGLLTLMACHRVVRANQSLNLSEIKALLAELDQVGFKAQCPHGRPVFKRLTLQEVERMFKRT